jgi:hypothetical protein
MVLASVRSMHKDQDELTDSYSRAYAKMEPIGRGRITCENIAAPTFPIVQFMRKLSLEGKGPDYVLGIDRGGRPVGLAVAILYHELYGNLPTVDGTIRFRKSVPEEPEETKDAMRSLVREIMKKRSLGMPPVVLLLDETMDNGETMNEVSVALNELSRNRIKIYRAALVDHVPIKRTLPSADVAGIRRSDADCEWLRKPGLVWIDYEDYKDSKGYSGFKDYEGPKPKLVNTDDALFYRRWIIDSVREFAEKLKHEVAEEKKDPITTSLFRT